MNYYIKYYYDEGYTTLKEIYQDEFNEISEARDLILFFLYFEELFEITKLNVFDYWKLYLETTEKYRLNIIKTNEDILSPIILFNQKLANILTAFQSYQDHLSTSIKNIYNEQAKEFFQRECSKVYDKYFSYRFFARLRNYVQHKGFPIKRISYSSQLIDDKVQTTIEITANKSELLQASVWSNIKPEIEVLDENVDFKKYLNEFLHSLYVLHKEMRNYFNERFNKTKLIIESIEQECDNHFYEKYGKQSKLRNTIEICRYDNGEFIDKFWLPTKRLETVIIYKAKNIFESPFVNSYTISY